VLTSDDTDDNLYLRISWRREFNSYWRSWIFCAYFVSSVGFPILRIRLNATWDHIWSSFIWRREKSSWPVPVIVVCTYRDYWDCRNEFDTDRNVIPAVIRMVKRFTGRVKCRRTLSNQNEWWVSVYKSDSYITINRKLIQWLINSVLHMFIFNYAQCRSRDCNCVP
jgi:hypothetical protein